MAMLAVAEDQPGGLPDLERELGGNDFVGPAANAVGPEISARDVLPLDASFGLVPRMLAWGRLKACPAVAIIRPSRRSYFKICE